MIAEWQSHNASHEMPVRFADAADDKFVPQLSKAPAYSFSESSYSRKLLFIESMKALPVQELPEGDWRYEIKYDG